MIISFSGRPGCGKTSLIRALMDMYSTWDYLDRVVTREQRDTDIEGRYAYVSEDAFDEALRRDELFMPFSVHGYRVAYTKASIWAFSKSGVGCVQFSHKTVPELTAFADGHVTPVHVLSPEESVLRNRLLARGDDPEKTEIKLNETRDWDSSAQQMDVPFIFIKNDGELAQAIKDLNQMVQNRLHKASTPK